VAGVFDARGNAFVAGAGLSRFDPLAELRLAGDDPNAKNNREISVSPVQGGFR